MIHSIDAIRTILPLAAAPPGGRHRARQQGEQGAVARGGRAARPSRTYPDCLAGMKQAVQTNPLTLGYGFSTWSATRLAEHLAKTTGIHFSDDQLRRLLHEHGFAVHRPKHTLKGKRDETAYRKATKELAVLKKTPCPMMLPK